MKNVPTIKVELNNGQVVVINKADFDESIHTIPEIVSTPAKKDKTETPAKGLDRKKVVADE